jgi:hypothetical protein
VFEQVVAYGGNINENVNGSKTVSSCALWQAGASTAIAKYGPVYIPLLQCPKQKGSYEFTRPLLEMFRTRIKKKEWRLFLYITTLYF